MNKNIELQQLRVPAGWNITLNNFYEVNSVDEYGEYFSLPVLISGYHGRMGIGFDSRYEINNGSSGDFILILKKKLHDKKGKLLKYTEMDVIKTKHKEEFIEHLESFMLTGEYFRDIKTHKLRVPSGWSMSFNNLYEIDPTEENIDYFSPSVLMAGYNYNTGLDFDVTYEIEGVPNGYFILTLGKLFFDKKGRMTNEIALDVKKTKQKRVLLNYIERFMKTGEY